LQVDDVHQALNFAARPAYVRWRRNAGAIDEERIVGSLRDLIDLPQQAGLHANVAGDPFGPYTGSGMGPNCITIVESDCVVAVV
jgi:hypothetical protein